MPAHITTSFGATPRNVGVSLCRLREQSRAEQSRGNTALLTVCSEDCQSDECANSAEQQGHTLLKEETYIVSLPSHARKMRGKSVSISEFELDFA